jgi:circadian clock protein KaiC
MSEKRLATGITGLDDILLGGWPAEHLYLIEGDPGTGKTTLALQFLLEGIRAGESVLYITLSESKRELQIAAESHGWDVDKVEIFELLPDESSLRSDRQYTVYHTSEVELADTTAAVLEQVEKLKPKRVVIDSLSELRMLAQDPLRYRRQILAFKQFFAVSGCTVLLLDDRTSTDRDLQLQSIAHGVLSMQNLPREYGTRRRRMELIKLRGSSFREGFHDYGITGQGGLVVYPRLVAAEHHPGFKPEKLLSGMAALDSLWGGGIDRGTSTLIMGPAGCGKSTIAAAYAIAAAKRGEHATIYLFDEGIDTMLIRLAGLGMDANSHVKAGRLVIEQIDPAELSPGEFVGRVRERAKDGKSRILVIDSLNGFLNAMPGEKLLALQLHELLMYLNQLGMATFMIMAQHGLVGPEMETVADVSYLADSVLLLRYLELAGEIKRAISVVKKRTGHHEHHIRELHMRGGLSVSKPLIEFRGILSGLPEREGERKPKVKAKNGQKN